MQPDRRLRRYILPMTLTSRCIQAAGTLALTLCAFAPRALALPPPPYAVFEFSANRPELDAPQTATPPVRGTGRDRSTTGWGFTLGWRFTDHLAVEGSYIQLGEARFGVDIEEGSPVTSARLHVGSRGSLLAMAGTWPVHEKVSLEGRAGFYWGTTETRYKGTTASPLGQGEFNMRLDSETKLAPAVGVGAVVAFSEMWGMRVGFDYLDKAFGKDATRAAIGVRFNWP